MKAMNSVRKTQEKQNYNGTNQNKQKHICPKQQNHVGDSQEKTTLRERLHEGAQLFQIAAI
jgi:hypothetical protein